MNFQKILKIMKFYVLKKFKKNYLFFSYKMEKEIRDIDAENRTAKYRKYLCEHGKYKYQCKECGGSQICPHNRLKAQCKECGGSQICPHGKRKSRCKGSQICPHSKLKYQCKECGGSQICPHDRQKSHCKKCSDPIKVNIEQWIFKSRQYDKMRNIYDADRFIDKCFMGGLIEDYKQCYYRDCEVNLQYTEYQDDLVTIERLDNSIGHIKSNCVLCCLKCNVSKKSNNLIYLS